MDKAKNLGLVLLGLGVIAGVVLLFALFIEGAVWVTVKLTPIVEWANTLAFVAAVFLIVPALTRFGRGFAAVSYLLVSYVFVFNAVDVRTDRGLRIVGNGRYHHRLSSHGRRRSTGRHSGSVTSCRMVRSW